MDVFAKIVRDVAVDFADEFDKNFQRQAFFDKRWKPRAFGKGTLLIKSGKLRRSVRYRVSGNTILFTSSEPYAEIQNYGGKITVTDRMKKYFWAMYKETEDEHYKYMALMRTGSTITIPQRQFIGYHKKLQGNVQNIVDKNMKQYMEQLSQKMKK